MSILDGLEPFPRDGGVAIVGSGNLAAHCPDGIRITAEIDGSDESIAEVVCRIECP